MNIIQCDEDCIYQREGYCSLEIPTMVTNDTGRGCVHQIHTLSKKNGSVHNRCSNNHGDARGAKVQPPQMPL